MIRSEGTPKTTHSEGGRELLSYEVESLRGLRVIPVFLFARDKLVRGKYVLAESHTNDNAYLRDFDTLKKALAEKYGPPHEDERLWNKDLYRDDRSEWGTALSAGHMMQFAKWSFKESVITMMAKGDNFNVRVAVEYTSQKYANLEKRVREESEAGKL